MGDITAFFGGQAFDPATVEPQGDFELLSPGKYIVLIEKAEVQQTKARDGHLLFLELKVSAGKYKDRKLFDRINIDNKSTVCVEIGMRCLSALAQAIGLQAVSDDSQLLMKTVVAHVKVKKGYNEVRTYSSPAGFDPNISQVIVNAPTAPGPAASPVAVSPSGVPVALAPPAMAAPVPPAGGGPPLPWQR